MTLTLQDFKKYRGCNIYVTDSSSFLVLLLDLSKIQINFVIVGIKFDFLIFCFSFAFCRALQEHIAARIWRIFVLRIKKYICMFYVKTLTVDKSCQ